MPAAVQAHLAHSESATASLSARVPCRYTVVSLWGAFVEVDGDDMASYMKRNALVRLARLGLVRCLFLSQGCSWGVCRGSFPKGPSVTTCKGGVLPGWDTTVIHANMSIPPVLGFRHRSLWPPSSPSWASWRSPVLPVRTSPFSPRGRPHGSLFVVIASTTSGHCPQACTRLAKVWCETGGAWSKHPVSSRRATGRHCTGPTVLPCIHTFVPRRTRAEEGKPDGAKPTPTASTLPGE